MYARFTDRARRVMQMANKEARRFGQENIGTGHILLGLVEEGSGVGGNVLKNLDIELHEIRRAVEGIMRPRPGTVTWGKQLPLTEPAKRAIKYSVEEARNLNHNYVGTEHLLLGLVHEEESVAAQVLRSFGLEVQQVREGVVNLLGNRVLPRDGGGTGSSTVRNKTHLERLSHRLGLLIRKIGPFGS